MKAAAFDYCRAGSLDEAQAVLARSGDAKLIAGGQSLGPLLNLRLVRPATLVDISALAELQSIDATPAGWRIGAGVTHARLEDGALAGCEVLSRVAAEISYRSIRNRGTIGGALAHADPSGDWTLALATLGARVVVRGPDKRVRTVAADQFTIAPFTTVLGPADIVVAVEVDRRSPASRFGYFKFCRKAGDYPEVSAAILCDPDRREARVLIGALGSEPKALAQIAERLAQADRPVFDDAAITAAIAAVAPGLDAIELRMRAAAVAQALSQVLDA